MFLSYRNKNCGAFYHYWRNLESTLESYVVMSSPYHQTIPRLFIYHPYLKPHQIQSAVHVCRNFRNQNVSLAHPFPTMPHLELLDLEKYWFGDWAPREGITDMFLLQNYGRQLTAFMCDGAFLDYAGSRHFSCRIFSSRTWRIRIGSATPCQECWSGARSTLRILYAGFTR
ncbi:unnamed protein product [Orchesella dallaii]|uniref:Uncharacterized protein n=1 Tax=Orchesella dallaii TaxID=48710 RepID=A0ABP1QJU0_9HEXA